MSDNPLSGEVKLDVSNYKAGVSELNRQIRVVESGFRASAAALGDWDRTSQGVEMRTRALTQQIGLQQQKVDGLKNVYGQLASEGKASAKEMQELQIKINRETESLNKMQSELGQSEKALAEMGNESKTTAVKVEDLGKKEDQTSAKTDKFKSVIGGLGAAMKVGVAAVAGLAAGVVGVGGAITKMVLDTAGAADGLQEMSDKTGISTERLQELSYVGKQVGTDADTMTGSMAKLIRSMSSAKSGTGDAADAFRTLGVSVTDANGKLRSNQDVFAEVIDKLGGVGNETERDALAMSLFGKSAQELNPLIKAGSGEINKLSQEAHKVGAVMSTEAVQGMADLNDSLDSLKDGFKGTLGTLATAFLPGFKALTGQASGYLQEFTAIVKGSNGDLGKMATGIGSLIGRIITDIAGQMPQLMQTGLGIVQSIITAIINALPTLLPAAIGMIQTLVTFITQNLPMLVDAAVKVVLMLVNSIITMLPGLIKAAIQIVITLAKGITAALPKLIPAIATIIPEIVMLLIDNLPLIIDAATKLIIALAEGLVTALPILLPAMPKIIKALNEALIISLPIIADATVKLIMIIVKGIYANLPLIGRTAVELINALAVGFQQQMGALLAAGGQIVTGLWQGCWNQRDWFTQQFLGFFTSVVDAIKAALGIHSPSTVFADIGKNIVTGLGLGFSTQFTQFQEDITGALADVSALFIAGGLELARIWNNTWTAIKNLSNVLWSGLKVFYAGLWEYIRSNAITMWENIKTSISDKWTATINFIKSFDLGALATQLWGDFLNSVNTKFGEIKTAISDGWQTAVDSMKEIDLYEVGKAFIQSLIDGLNSMMDSLGNTLKEIADAIRRILLGWLGIGGADALSINLNANGILRNAAASMPVRGNGALSLAAQSVQNTDQFTFYAPVYIQSQSGDLGRALRSKRY